MKQKEFAKQAVKRIKSNPDVVGLAAGGSWITNELDEYSDLDLILITENKISQDKTRMIDFASSLGELLNAFTGEHVMEPRLLICMYDNPLLHVDIKFLTLKELEKRVEDPVVLYERNNALTRILKSTKSEWPEVDFQWIEDRFWTWIHYIALKIGRGELFEALDSITYLRMIVIAPLMQIRTGELPRGLRKVEFDFSDSELSKLKETVSEYNAGSIIHSLEKIIKLYRELRIALYDESVLLNGKLEEKTNDFINMIKNSVEKKLI